ncbi:ribonuclease H-like domain-containing protein [Chaetomium sp. MPI-CAGE-AT-0009]|nr:ribonuclease H-like domain-containing protein [Chaetomium sp. MPI-CAGE-AT-0009]
MATNTPPSSPTLISSLPDLRAFLSSIPPSSTFYLDLEGKSLSRNGTLSLLTVLVHPTRATSIVDVQTLGNAAFTTPRVSGIALKAILEDLYTYKYFWDVRNDADALWVHHKVRPAGVIDVQLLENGSRVGDKTYLHGLDKSVKIDLGLKFMDVYCWVKIKKDVQALMPNDIFAYRPLDAMTIQYCVNDVIYLPVLHNLYTKRITSEWLGKAIDESARRVVEAYGPTYEPQSEKKKFGPWGSALGKNVLTMDEWLEKLEEDQMEARARDMFGYDDDDDDGYLSFDDPVNSRDVARDDTFDSCWEK